MIKLFATDLDGTLLNAFHTADRTVLDAVRTVLDAGAHLALATGRTMRSSNEFGFEGLNVDLLGSNGAIVRTGAGELLKTFPVDKAALEEMLRAFPNVCFECVAPDGTFITGTHEERDAGFRRDSMLRRIVMRGMRGKMMEDPTTRFSQTVAQILEHEVCKVNARIVDPGLEHELKAYLAEHADVLVNAPFDPVMFEISQAGANKGTGVAWLASYLGIAEDEVAVYGDGGNDIAMLERFEHAYATSNGSDEAKHAAGHVIGNCAFHAVPRHMVATVRADHSHVVID